MPCWVPSPWLQLFKSEILPLYWSTLWNIAGRHQNLWRLDPACMTPERHRVAAFFDVAASAFCSTLHDDLLRFCPPIQNSDRVESSCKLFFLSNWLKRKIIVLRIKLWFAGKIRHSLVLQYYGWQVGTKDHEKIFNSSGWTKFDWVGWVLGGNSLCVCAHKCKKVFRE